MYKEFYGLEQDPFRLTPDPQFFYLADKHNKALANLLYGINHKKGFIALTGEVGCGKTTLCRLLLNQLDKNTSVAIILNSLVDELTFLKQINRDFAIPYETDSHDDLVGYLYDYLISEKKKGNNVVIIVDECQNLKFEVLEQIRMLSNLETEKDKLLQILLIGQPEFIEMLNSYELRQLNQRITVRAHITSLGQYEMEKYIYHRLKIAGNEKAVEFTQGALSKIYKFSNGIPRKVNVISDYALLAGYVDSSRKITKRHVEKALNEIQVKRKPKDKENNIRLFPIFRKLAIACILLTCIVVFKETLKVNAANFSSIFHQFVDPYLNQNIKQPEAKIQEINPLENIVKEENTKKELKKVEEVKEEVQVLEPVIEKKEIQLKPELHEDKAQLPDIKEKPVQKTEVKEPEEETTEKPETKSITKETKQEIIHETLIEKNVSRVTPEKLSRSEQYFMKLSPKEKGIWLLLSTWGLEINHERRSYDGKIISLESQLNRLNFSLFQTWADLELIKTMNLPTAFKMKLGDREEYWILNYFDGSKMRFFKSPGQFEYIQREQFEKLWKDSVFLIVEQGRNTLNPKQVIYRGQNNSQVEMLKDILFRLNYYDGDIDQVFDYDCELAMKKFQKSYHLTDDAIVGEESKLLFYSLLTKNIPRITPRKKAGQG